jgi:hypothetical protein
MSVVKLPAVGIVLGSLAAPKHVIGLAGRPCDLPLAAWLNELLQQGCRLRITPTSGFLGSYVECPGDGSCDVRERGTCPLEP